MLREYQDEIKKLKEMLQNPNLIKEMASPMSSPNKMNGKGKKISDG